MRIVENIEAISPKLWLLCAPLLNITTARMRLWGTLCLRKCGNSAWLESLYAVADNLKCLCGCEVFPRILLSSVQVVTTAVVANPKLSENISLCVLSEILCRWTWAKPCVNYEHQNVSTAVKKVHSPLMVVVRYTQEDGKADISTIT